MKKILKIICILDNIKINIFLEAETIIYMHTCHFKQKGFSRIFAIQFGQRQYVFGFEFSKVRALERLHVTMGNVDRSRSEQKGRPGGPAAHLYLRL